MIDNTYTPRDWLLLFGMATLLLSWWVSFRMVRARREAVDLGPRQLT